MMGHPDDGRHGAQSAVSPAATMADSEAATPPEETVVEAGEAAETDAAEGPNESASEPEANRAVDLSRYDVPVTVDSIALQSGVLETRGTVK
jgi:hypothetical protein